MSETFTISSENPNDNVGGGGCLCAESKQQDCEPPYVIFFAQSFDNHLSPNVVGCHRCIVAAAEALQNEALAAGEPVIDVTEFEELTADEAAEAQAAADAGEAPIDLDPTPSAPDGEEFVSLEELAEQELEAVPDDEVPEV